MLLFSGMILIYACKKDVDRPVVNDFDYQQIKNWYDSRPNHNNANRFISFIPQWDDVHVIETPEQLIYEVTLSNPGKIFLSEQVTTQKEVRDYIARNNTRMIIFKDKRNDRITGGAFMSVVNESRTKNFRSIHYKQVENFSGSIYYHNIDGIFVNGWSYREGLISERLSPSSNEEYLLYQKQISNIDRKSFNNKIQKVPGQICLVAQVPFWGSTCVDGGCEYYITGYETISVCVDSPTPGGSGGDGGYTGPGGGGGGSGPTTGNGQVREVKNLVVDSCIREAVNIAFNAKNTVRNMLDDVFNETQFTDFAVEFRDVTTLPDNIDGQTYNLNTLTIAIDLNKIQCLVDLVLQLFIMKFCMPICMLYS